MRPRPSPATVRLTAGRDTLGDVLVRSDRRFTYDAPPDEVWEAFGRTDAYGEWWPWLVEFDATTLQAGEVWRCAVRPPLPYTLRFSIELVEVVRPRLVTAQVDGDLRGSARLEITGTDSGSDVRLVSALGPNGMAFRLLAGAMRPVARYGHDWIIDAGAAQFAKRALSDGAGEASE